MSINQKISHESLRRVTVTYGLEVHNIHIMKSYTRIKIKNYYSDHIMSAERDREQI